MNNMDNILIENCLLKGGQGCEREKIQKRGSIKRSWLWGLPGNSYILELESFCFMGNNTWYIWMALCVILFNKICIKTIKASA